MASTLLSCTCAVSFFTPLFLFPPTPSLVPTQLYLYLIIKGDSVTAVNIDKLGVFEGGLSFPNATAQLGDLLLKHARGTLLSSLPLSLFSLSFSLLPPLFLFHTAFVKLYFQHQRMPRNTSLCNTRLLLLYLKRERERERERRNERDEGIRMLNMN